MTNVVNEELEGTTLNVYACVVKEGKPVGTREIMRIANLTSPSLARWHLQKLEGLGLLNRDEYGNYIVKEKVNISGHVWIGRTLIPRLIFYSFFFIGILAVEITIIAIPLIQSGQTPQLYLYYLISPTVIAMILFLGEGIWLRRKTRCEGAQKKTAQSSNSP